MHSWGGGVRVNKMPSTGVLSVLGFNILLRGTWTEDVPAPSFISIFISANQPGSPLQPEQQNVAGIDVTLYIFVCTYNTYIQKGTYVWMLFCFFVCFFCFFKKAILFHGRNCITVFGQLLRGKTSKSLSFLNQIIAAKKERTYRWFCCRLGLVEVFSIDFSWVEHSQRVPQVSSHSWQGQPRYPIMSHLSMCPCGGVIAL